MQQKIKELEKGWSVLVLMHQLFNPCYVKDGKQKTTLDPNGRKVMKGIDKVFDELDATVIGVLGGHCHRDECLRSAKGYPLISTTADSFTRAVRFDFNYPSAKLGTINEHAFDCVHIDTAERRITMTRIGRGARSRIYAY